jgi:hypothetical protein
MALATGENAMNDEKRGDEPPKEPLCPWNPAITKAELDRRAAEPGGLALAEFWKRFTMTRTEEGP